MADDVVEVCRPCRAGHHDRCLHEHRCPDDDPLCQPTDDGIDWGDPPVELGGRRKEPVLDEETLARLRANPGRWARVMTSRTTSAAGWRVRRIHAEHDGIQAVNFPLVGHSGVMARGVWARYAPEQRATLNKGHYKREALQ